MPLYQLLLVPALAASLSGNYLSMRELTKHNDNPLIDKWAKEIGLNNQEQLKRTGTGFFWCLLFVRGMYEDASKEKKVKNPLPKVARVSVLWDIAQEDSLTYEIKTPDEIMSGAKKLKPGDIMIMLYGNGPNPNGHTGLNVKQISNLRTNTREGNTNANGSREGDGVYNKVRNISSTVGFISIK